MNVKEFVLDPLWPREFGENIFQNVILDPWVGGGDDVFYFESSLRPALEKFWDEHI